ncbi:MAG: CHAT domain-containing protein [Anaerolineae bacterium]
MPKYNLNERQRQIVRELAAVAKDGFDEEFAWIPTIGRKPAITFRDRNESIAASETDLITLQSEGFVTLRREGRGYYGVVRQLALDAVDLDFERETPASGESSVAIGNFIQNMTGGNVQGAAGSGISMPQNAQQESKTGFGNVLAVMGDIFEGSADLTILPCSGKGTVSSATRRWLKMFCIPSPMEISSQPRFGDISDLINFPGDQRISRYVVYAASVLNDFSSAAIIRGIAAKLGSLTQIHPEIRLIQTPLLGTGAGGLGTEVSGKALYDGFRSTAHPDSILHIFVFDRERQTTLQALIDEMTSEVRPPVKAIAVQGILFLAADPSDLSRLRLGEEFREIQEKLKLARLRDRFRLELPQLSVRPADISQALLDVQPQIVHFSSHGTPTGELYFENHLGKAHPVQPEALADLFEHFADHVDCVLLNACYSEPQAQAIARHIRYVIGMNQEIGDKAAIAFVIGFYQALGAGRTIEIAYKLGCAQIGLHGIPEHLTPVLIKKE